MTLLVLALGVAGCGAPTLRGTVPRPEPVDSGPDFRAGAAKVDITPPPGVPMGGHSLAGKVARGFWSRLYARAIYLEAAGTRLVLVSVDLWAFPAGLGDRILEVLAERGAGATIGRGEVVFAATHTHQSPGGFATSNFYNQMAARQAGFDERVFEFLADRIAKAIDDARATAVSARLGFAAAPLSGIQVNRSLDAYLLNPEAAALLESQPPSLPPEIGFSVHPDAHLAIDPTLRVLRLDTPAGEPIAVAAFAAVHNTTMGHATELYTADFLGVAASGVELALATRSTTSSPVVALFNGPEGDVSPTWRWQDSRDALRLGGELADAVIAAVDSAEPVDTTAGFRRAYEVVEIAGACSSRDARACAAEHPMMGVATAGGAEDGRSGFWELGWKEGITGPPRDDGHGRKQPAADPPFVPLELPFGLSPTRLFFPLGDGDVPRTTPIGVYAIGDVALATLPGEFTTTLGSRIAQGVAAAVEGLPERTILVGLANEYLSYFTTPEEYDAQHYEGASTIYGRWVGSVVLDAIVGLARRLGGPTDDRSRDFEYRPGERRRFGVRSLGDRSPSSEDHLRAVTIDASGAVARGLPTACWADAIPALPDAYSGPGFADELPVTPRVRVQHDRNGDWVDVAGADDAGLQLPVYVVEVGPVSATWCATWMPANGATVDPDRYRLVVRTTSMESVFCPLSTGRAARFAHLSPCG